MGTTGGDCLSLIPSTSAAVVGTKKVVGDDFLYNNAVPVLILQMENDRAGHDRRQANANQTALQSTKAATANEATAATGTDTTPPPERTPEGHGVTGSSNVTVGK